MGSNLSPIIADITVNFILQEMTNRVPIEFPFLYQYVDDIVCAIPENAVQAVLDTLNKFDDHLDFTVEIEKEGGVPFLDTFVTRSINNEIRLNWYQKRCPLVGILTTTLITLSNKKLISLKL